MSNETNWDLLNLVDQKILNTWDIVDDLKDIVTSIEDGDVNLEETKEFLAALAVVYQMKFEQLHNLNSKVYQELVNQTVSIEIHGPAGGGGCGAQCDEEVLDFGKPETSSEVVKASCKCNCRWPPDSNLSCDDELYE